MLGLLVSLEQMIEARHFQTETVRQSCEVIMSCKWYKTVTMEN